MSGLRSDDALTWKERLDAAGPGVVPVDTGKTVWNQSQIIDQLASGAHWSGGTISYSFPTSAGFFSGGEASGFSTLNGGQREAARLAMELWDDLIAPRIVEESGAGGDVTFSNTTTNIGYAHAYFPGGWSGAGSIWLNGNSGSLQDPDVGEWGFMTFLHEIGHALGLDHAGDYNGGSPTYERNGSHAQDTLMFTVMSYFGEEHTGADWRFSDGQYAVAQTPMVHDVLAIQAAYGEDTTTRTGDTIYGFNSNTGSEIFDFDVNRHPVLTIWDAGGEDTLDLSGFSDDALVNLAPGSYSDAGGAINNLAIAFGAWIENAVGGRGDDEISGNVRGNKINGGHGRDTLEGKAGADRLHGGGAADKISGGSGRDVVIGGAGGDNLRGDAAGDHLRGGKGADRLIGGDGRDVLIGGDAGGGFPGDGAADVFVFRDIGETARGHGNRDVIRDFEAGRDVIDLSGIDAVEGGGDSAFTFIGAAGFSGRAGELRAVKVGNNTLISGDVDGDAQADFEIFLNGAITLGSDDFLL